MSYNHGMCMRGAMRLCLLVLAKKRQLPLLWLLDSTEGMLMCEMRESQIVAAQA